jgi:GT2 family glycosyltransferase
MQTHVVATLRGGAYAGRREPNVDWSRRYSRSSAWRIGASGSTLVLENQQGGGVVIDETVERIVEQLGHQTTEEIVRAGAFDAALVETVARTMSRIGMLEVGSGQTTEAAPRAPNPPLPHTPLVSIVVVNYNGEAFLPALLESIARQSYRDIEVLVVDNDSSDGSRTLVRERFSTTVGLLELNHNRGFAHGVNAGLAKVRGELVLVLNSDTVLADDAVRELVRTALACETWSAIAPKIMYHDNPCFVSALGNTVRDHDWGADNFFGFLDLGQFDRVTDTPSACFAAALLNRTAIERIGDLDERYRFYYEDVDWCYRAQLLGLPVHVAPAAVVYHRVGASMSRRAASFKLRHVVGNRLYFACKVLAWGALKRALGNYLREDARKIRQLVRVREIETLAAYAIGYLRFILSLPSLLPKRRVVQRTRTIPTDDRLLPKTLRPGFGLLHDGKPVLTSTMMAMYYMDSGIS